MTTLDVMRKHPFKAITAKQIAEEDIVRLFVPPSDFETTPFDFENTILKGHRGGVKTMFLLRIKVIGKKKYTILKMMSRKLLCFRSL